METELEEVEQYVSAYYGNLHIQMNNTILNFNRAHHQGGAVYLSQYNSNYEPVH